MDLHEKLYLRKRAREEGVTVKVNGRYLIDRDGEILIFYDLEEAIKAGKKASLITDIARGVAILGTGLLTAGGMWMAVMPEVAGWEALVGGLLIGAGLLTLMRYR